MIKKVRIAVKLSFSRTKLGVYLNAVKFVNENPMRRRLKLIFSIHPITLNFPILFRIRIKMTKWTAHTNRKSNI